MLIGYVSDELYSAIPDVLLEFIAQDGTSHETRSRASGTVYADLKSGTYTVILQKPGFGPKRSTITVQPGDSPIQFRLLSDRLMGYAWPKWVRSGEQSEFRVHSPEAYQLELWRYGLAPERIAELGWHDEHAPRATAQITPDGDYTQTGTLWNSVGYVSDTHRQFVTAPCRSGLYYFRARTHSGQQFSFPWIVAPAQPTARIAVLASNMTWNAYNNFGGRSNYLHADGLPPTPTVHARSEHKRYQRADHQTWGGTSYPPLSFDRPEPFCHVAFDETWTDPVEGRQACHLAPAEWRLLAWMEREGFGYDYYAENQLDDGTLNLDAYKVLILSVHPEYWTRRMYDRVKTWVSQNSGKLVYLGGNGLNCEVELSADGTSMTCHNGTISSLWPQGMHGQESRFAMRHESEAHLLGIVFTPAGAMTGAPYQVLKADHWAFAGTGLRPGEQFGTLSLHRRCPGGASGHETDKCSKSSPPGMHLLARGLNPDNGGAEIVQYDTPSGGSVFSVGSINYVLSLPVDHQVSRITANVLRRYQE
ncbi:MAG: carboxypeptidase-like regulatory domain-containing protein [Bacteroidales bacterium]|nr:carboxypeptidase-like regulatory domain-containing protein [Bacteroidales bacterium]